MKQNERLFEAIGEVGEDLILEAEYRQFDSPWQKWSSTAAAVLVVAMLTAVAIPILPRGCGSMPKEPKSAESVLDNAAGTNAPESAAPAEEPLAEEAMEEKAEAPELESEYGAAEVPEQEVPAEETDPFKDNPPGTDGIDPEEPINDAGAFTGPVETEGDFWKLFPELDMQSMVVYMDTHPGLIENGWSELVINEAGLDRAGTEIYTTNGDQVLDIDVPNRILLVRVRGETVTEEMKSEQAVTYQGVLAIAKDPSRLSLQVCEHYGVDGDTVGTIAQAHDGVLSINASPFLSMENGNAGVPEGYVRADGRDRNGRSEEPYDRLELGEDNFLRITSGDEPLGDDVTDAMEFIPAMLVDGQVQEAVEAFDGLAPRTCIAQRENGELLMLVIEGRLPDYSEGTDLSTCAEILLEYGAYQAMALDYGSSSIMWYDGLYVTKCSVEALPEGRFLPDAFVYSRKGG